MRAFLLSLFLSLNVSLPCWAGASRSFAGTTNTNNINFGTINYSTPTLPFFVAAWVNATAINSASTTIVGYGSCCSANVGGWALKLEQYNNTGNIGFSQWGSGGTDQNFTSLSSPTGGWAFVGCLKTSTTATKCFKYVAGTLTTQTLTTGAAFDATDANPLYVGNFPVETAGGLAFGECMNGLISVVVSCESCSPTDAEILEIAHNPQSIARFSPKFLIHLTGQSPERELSANAYSGTVTGATSNGDGPPIFFTPPLAWRHWFDRVLDWLTPSVFADDIILCNPIDPTVPGRVSSYQRSADPFKSGAVSNPNSLIWSLPASPVNPWDGLVPNAPQSYWKCSGNTVIEMSAAEKTTLDAPQVAEAARQQTFMQEINGTTGNDICHAELADITTKVNTWLAARQAELDAATTSAQVKASLRDQFYPAVAQALLKVMKCTRAVQR